MAGSVTQWIPIPANSPMIQYTGSWDFNASKPLEANATAAMNFTGSGIAFAGYGDAGSYTSQGMLFNIDPESQDPYNTTLLLSYTKRPGGDDRWIERDLPPGEHVIELSSKAPNLDVTFLGFEVQLNATIPTNWREWPEFIYDRTLTSDYLLTFGQVEEEDNTTYFRDDRGGFSFNFTGAAIEVYGQDSFSQATNYSVWFNVTDIASTKGIAPYAQFRAEQGRGGVLFYAGALPQGDHRLLLVKDQAPSGETYDDIGFKNATVYYPQLHSNYTEACFGSCGSGGSQRGIGYGNSFDRHSDANRKVGWSVGLAFAGVVAGIALAV